MNKHHSKNQKQISGIIKRHADGFGFLIPDDINEEDVYIPKHSMVGIMTNDKLLVTVIHDRAQQRSHGEVLKILSRGTKYIVGKISTLNEKWKIIPDDSKAWGKDLKIKTEDALYAKDNELVHVEITSYPDEATPFSGKVIEVIGSAEDPLNDTIRVLRTLSVPTHFSKLTLEETSHLHENPEPYEYKNRVNLMNTPLITIDGATAKDFDDAVFVEQTSEGFRLIVAIADVSHYVRPGTHLDNDAKERGTSVYFPNYVVPMLPEKISNGLCSLKPNVPRLCVAAEMNFNWQGEMVKSNFFEAVMNSHARVTYGEAQEVIDGNEIALAPIVKENILRCYDLAQILMKKRFNEGSLDLNLSETFLEIDAAGNPVDVQKTERLFAHRLIEELMLAANVSVAKFLSSKEIPSVYRVHEEPSSEDVKILETYLFNLGLKIHLRSSASGNLQKKLTKALEEFENHSEGQIISLLTLRSLSQAKYSTNNIGHFGLGFECYTHFTSPIRRYPDLIVHRLLKSQILKDGHYLIIPEDILSTETNMLSACEQRAVKCERQFYSIKKARFVQNLIGQEFKGLISSVARFGIFVLLREYDIDGLVKLENLGNDKWIFDEDHLKLVGDRSKKVFSIGQWVQIKITGSNVELGQIDFDLMPDEKLQWNAKSKLSSFLKETSREDFDHPTPYGEKNKKPKEVSQFFKKINRKEKSKISNMPSEPAKTKFKSRNSFNETTQLKSKGDSEYKPKYSSLSDYLEKNKHRRTHQDDGDKMNKLESSKKLNELLSHMKTKPGFGSSKNQSSKRSKLNGNSKSIAIKNNNTVKLDSEKNKLLNSKESKVTKTSNSENNKDRNKDTDRKNKPLLSKKKKSAFKSQVNKKRKR